MAAIPASVREVIASGRLAHCIAPIADGSPQMTCGWVGIDGDEIVMGHLPEHRKVKNVHRDPRMSLSIEAEAVIALGLPHYLVVYGRARVTEHGAPKLLLQIAHRYLGPEVRFPTMPNPPPGYITRISPERHCGVGP